MNILFLFHNYRDGDGGSSAVDSLIERNKSFGDDYLVVCKFNNTKKTNNIVTEEEEATIVEFLSRPNVLINYVRSMQSNILNHILKLSKKNIPVVMTVVQSPGYKRLMLSPYEILHSNLIVFIDKTSYNHHIISFIPPQNRVYIYLMSSGRDDRIQRTEDIFLERNSGTIVYGRGSTLYKCPKDMFKVFDKIGVENKLFRIVGIPEGDNWVRREAAKRPNVEVYPQLKYDDWFEMCKSFDVFLYQLPDDCYASIDGTLGLAICMRKPVVYMGCDAPKERLVHEESGFIANSVDEMARYATSLGKDFNLRKSIGEKGRERLLLMAKDNNSEQRYHEAYEKSFSLPKIRIVPFSYRLRYLCYCYKDIVRNLLNYYK